MRNGVNHIDKQDFLEAYYYAHKKTMIFANIQSSFAATGVFPYDPEQVLVKLNTQLRTLTLLPMLGIEPWAPETLHNITEL